MATTRSRLAREIWRHLFDFIIDTAAHRNRVLGAYALSPNDARALFVLDDKSGRTMGSLAEEWGTDASYVTSLIDRLERKGLATRAVQRGDRRIRLVRLTTAGSKLKRQLARALYEPPEELLAMSHADLAALWSGIAKLRARRSSSRHTPRRSRAR